ncbi:hypothetical protein ABVV53_04975 [Novosphingobium sp. RD2P27]|uniref:Uncharacterized protein n=1 Tax=Novosphingobium kalidii TaxID=3230299 RepID=A0ABV2CZ08_9SPHN
MDNRDDLDKLQRSKKSLVLPATLVVLLVIFSLYGLAGGLGESVGIEEAAPGDTNSTVNPAADPEN